MFVIFAILHAAMVWPILREQFCPMPNQLNPSLFVWSPLVQTCLATILLAAPIRLLAFRQLGKDFTFQLAKPSRLRTTGLYAYVQHPSYPPDMLVSLANFYLFFRTDGVTGCVLPEFIVGSQIFAGFGSICYIYLNARVYYYRVLDEEEMLHEAFGKEWEDWHARTARFIPGVF